MENLKKLLPLGLAGVVGLGASAFDIEGQEAMGLALGAAVVTYGVQTLLSNKAGKPAKGGKGGKKGGKKPAPVAADSDNEEADLEDEASAPVKEAKAKKPKKKKAVKANSANSNAEESKRKRVAVAGPEKKKDSSHDLPITMGGGVPQPAPVAPAATDAKKQQAAAQPAAAAAEDSKNKKKKNKKKAKAAQEAAAAEEEFKEAVAEPSLEEQGWTQIKKSSRRNKASAAAAEASADGKEPKEAKPVLHTVTIQVPGKQHGKIIGEKGATLQVLQTHTGTKIDIPKKETNSQTITISGADPEGVESCRKAIEQLATLGFSHITHPGTTSGDVSIPAAKHGGIIGKGGQFLKTIQEATGTQIRMPEKTATNQNKITIIGPKEGIKAAKEAIRAIARDGFCSLTHPEWIKDELDFPRDSFPLLIGHKGQTIKSIQGDTRTRINIPDVEDPQQTVSVVGLPEDVRRACIQIMRLLEPPPAPVFEEPAPHDTWGAALPVEDGW